MIAIQQRNWVRLHRKEIPIPPDIHATSDFKKKALHLHLHHEQYGPSWIHRLVEKCETSEIDLYITVTDYFACKVPSVLMVNSANVSVSVVENKGRDLRPFYITLRAQLETYEVIGHFHGKRTNGLGNRKLWVKDLFEFMDKTTARPDWFKLLPDSSSFFLWMPDLTGSLGTRFFGWNACNRRMLKSFRSIAKSDDKFLFPAGSFFWMSSQLYNRVSDSVEDNLFREEDGLRDGGYEHFLERLPGVLSSRGIPNVHRLGKTMLVIGQS